MRTIFTVLALGATLALAQRRLALPDPRSCANRVRHATYRDARGVAHSYFFSWEHQPTRSLEVDWLDARNICRRHCMDAVSLETPQVSVPFFGIFVGFPKKSPEKISKFQKNVKIFLILGKRIHQTKNRTRKCQIHLDFRT